MRAEKYELFLRGERFFRHPVIRVCGNFRRKHYAVIAERVAEARRAVVEGSEPGYGRAGGEPARAVSSRGKARTKDDEGERGGRSRELPRRRRRRREEGTGFRHTGGEECRYKVEKRECSRPDHPGYPHICPKHHRRRK